MHGVEEVADGSADRTCPHAVEEIVLCAEEFEVAHGCGGSHLECLGEESGLR